MIKRFWLPILLLGIVGISSGQSPTAVALRPVPPPLLAVAGAAQPVRLATFKAEAKVVGHLARTTVEMTFHNPNGRILEGELQFPLHDGQQVTGFALDFAGKWRPAVPVDKAKGRQVFEAVTRVRVDPALLEATQGNNFKLRIYPLPANGDRRVQLTIEERLPATADHRAEYRLTIPAGERLDSFEFHLAAPTRHAAQVQALRGLGDGQIAERADGTVVDLVRRDYQPEATVAVALAAVDGPLSTTEERDGRHYFYAEIATGRQTAVTRPKPARLALVWDASGSGRERDHGREFALLDAYFKVLGDVEVDLTLARDQAERGGHHSIHNGDWSSLRKALADVAYDGATSLAAFRPPQAADAVLLFTDGLGNYGAPTMPVFTVPLFAVNAAASADSQRLRHVCAASGGAFIDLTSTSTDTAVSELRSARPQLVGLQSFGATDLASSSQAAVGGRIAIAGVLTEKSTEIALEWQLPSGQRQVQKAAVSRGVAAGEFAAREWARLRLAELDAEYELNRGEIRRLGKAFGLVTRETSLIVLDRVEDYVRYEIQPPLELRADYEQAIGKVRIAAEKDRGVHLEDIVHRFQDKQRWWEKAFPKGEPVKPKGLKVAAPAAPVASSATMLERGAPAVAEGVAPAQQRLAAPLARMAMSKSAQSGAGDQPEATAIRLQPWRPDSTYAERIRRAEPSQRYRVYLDERAGNLQSTAFFLDAADIFFAGGETQLGLRVLSNLAEMNLENRAILRILGYRLLQAKQPALAIPALERVLALAPDEPQSWRDLGLAYADAGERQKAIEYLYQVVIRPWDGRFPDIDLTALAEMNALIATSPTKLDTAAIDPRLLRNLPLDLRAVLSWDADNTDIDLWVTDPNGEKAFYGNPLTYQGGRMSRDFTGGYGPEEFSLKKAKPGKYLVQAQFFGHSQQVVSSATTLQLKLSTGFGTAQQRDQMVTLRLQNTGAQVTVGEFVVGDDK
jgi:tetratricopeptide (TPR) repeat protein